MLAAPAPVRPPKALPEPPRQASSSPPAPAQGCTLELEGGPRGGLTVNDDQWIVGGHLRLGLLCLGGFALEPVALVGFGGNYLTLRPSLRAIYRLYSDTNRELELRVQERTAALVAAHQETRENEERLRMGAEVARMAAWDWNLRTDTKRWSCDPEQLFGFPPGTLGLGMRLSSVLHADDRTGSQEAVDRALRTGRFEHECRAVRADGTIVWITERGRLVRGAVDPLIRARHPGGQVRLERREGGERQTRQGVSLDVFDARLRLAFRPRAVRRAGARLYVPIAAEGQVRRMEVHGAGRDIAPADTR